MARTTLFLDAQLAMGGLHHAVTSHFQSDHFEWPYHCGVGCEAQCISQSRTRASPRLAMFHPSIRHRLDFGPLGADGSIGFEYRYGAFASTTGILLLCYRSRSAPRS